MLPQEKLSLRIISSFFPLLYGESELLPTFFWGCNLLFFFFSTCAWLKSADTEAASHTSIVHFRVGQVRDSGTQILDTCSLHPSWAQCRQG